MALTCRLAVLLVVVNFTVAARAQSPAIFRSVLSYGASPDGKTLDTEAINRAIADCSSNGGGTVDFPAGAYLAASIELRSDVTLCLEAGAVVLGSTNLLDYALEPDPKAGESPRTGLITARHASNVSIVGRGVIEGNAMAYMQPNKLKLHEGTDYDTQYTRQGNDFMNPKFGTADGPLEPSDRPGNMIRFLDCTNILLQGVTLRNSPIWTVQFARCARINISGLSINSFASRRRVPNDDGIDLVESRDAHISGCDIQNGDDCIAVLGSQRITVDNCTLSSRSMAVRVGFSEAPIRDCVFANLVIHDSNRGLGVTVRGAGSIENVLFSDIVIETRLMTGHWWGKAEPIHISALPGHSDTRQLGQIRNIHFRNIIAESQSGVVLYGCPQSVIKDVSFEGVKIWMRNGPLQESYGGNFDLRPHRDVAAAIFAHEIPAFYGRYVDDLAIRGLEVEWDETLPSFFTHGIQLEDFSNVEIDGFRGGPAPKSVDKAAIVLSRGSVISIRDSTAKPGTSVFVSVSNVKDPGLLVNNDLRAARTICEPETVPFQTSGNVPPQARQ